MTQQQVRVRHPGPVPAHEGARRLPQRLVRTRRTALFLADGISVDEWKRVGESIHVFADSSTWWLGDWLVYGQRAYPDRYRRAVADTALDYQTLRNYAWVAGRFPPARRRAALSFGHHAEVAALPDRDQDAWLDRALAEGWSRNTLRGQVRAVRARADDGASSVVQVLVRIDAVQMDRWREAAGRARRELTEWMTVVLDEAAGAGTDAAPH